MASRGKKRAKSVSRTKRSPKRAGVLSIPAPALKPQVLPPVPPQHFISRPPQTPFASVLYLYGVSRVPSAGLAQMPVLSDPPGIDGHAAIEAWTFGNFLCWLSRVPRTEFVDRLHQRMEDLDWLSHTSVRHQRAVTAIAHEMTILPARFGTVFLSERSLAEDLRKRTRQLEADLSRITDADEWSLKLFAIPQRRSAIEISLGRLQRERMEALPQQQLEQDIQRLSNELNKVVVAMADGRRRSGAGVRPNLEWQVSLLVRRNRREKLRAVLEKFGKRWEGRRRIECTGPWPPFAFARIDSFRKANHEEAATIEAAPVKAVNPAPPRKRPAKSKTRSKARPKPKTHSKRKPVPKRRSRSKRPSRRRR